MSLIKYPSFEDFFPTRTSSVNIKENDSEFGIELSAPGMDKDGFDISIDNRTLTISSSKKTDKTEKKENYLYREFRSSSFSRSFSIPSGVDTDNIKATYENGILNISIPKSEKRELKKIEIQ